MAPKIKKITVVAAWLMLMGSPFLDLVNGIWNYLLNGGNGGMLSTRDLIESGVGPSSVVRIVFLLIMAAYALICRRKKIVAVFVVIGISWAATFAFALSRGREAWFYAEAEYIVRFCYCLLSMLVWADVLKVKLGTRDTVEMLDKAFCVAALTAAAGVLLPYIFGMGFFTYADRLGVRGSRGFYYAGNDITVVMMVLMPVLTASWMEEKNWKSAWALLKAVAVALCAVAMLLIGTKTAFAGLGATVVILPVYGLVRGLMGRGWRELARVAAVAAMAALAFFALGLLGTDPAATVQSSIDTVGAHVQEEAGLAIFSGRIRFLRQTWGDFAEALPLSALLGIGRGGQEKIIEMDLCEVFIYYGALGCITMLWLYLSQGIRAVIELFRNFSLRNLAACLALGLCVGFLAIAGHVLFSVTAGFYFAFMLAYTRIVCSRKGADTELI